MRHVKYSILYSSSIQINGHNHYISLSGIEGNNFINKSIIMVRTILDGTLVLLWTLT